MVFDQQTKDLARAHDAVDQLREVQLRIRDDEDSRQSVHDAIIRGAIVGLTVYLVVFAYFQL